MKIACGSRFGFVHAGLPVSSGGVRRPYKCVASCGRDTAGLYLCSATLLRRLDQGGVMLVVFLFECSEEPIDHRPRHGGEVRELQ